SSGWSFSDLIVPSLRSPSFEQRPTAEPMARRYSVRRGSSRPGGGWWGPDRGGVRTIVNGAPSAPDLSTETESSRWGGWGCRRNGGSGRRQESRISEMGRGQVRLVTVGVGAQNSPRFGPAGLLVAHRGVR